MTTRCTCSQAEGTHHHGFGGTYPCAGPVDCIPCQPTRQANGRDIETPERVLTPKQVAHFGPEGDRETR